MLVTQIHIRARVHEAFTSRGYPKDADVYSEGVRKLVIRHGDCLHDLRGVDLQCDSCLTGCRNLCREVLKSESPEFDRKQNDIHGALEAWCDRWGKDTCNEATKLVMVACVADDGVVHRSFHICGRAIFKPKFSLWVVCKWSNLNRLTAEVDLEFPFEVEICGAPMRIAPGFITVDVQTSDELALQFARMNAGFLYACELSYEIPSRGHLLNMLVGSVAAELTFDTTPKRTSGSIVSGIRNLFADGVNPFGITRPPRVAAARGGHRGGRGSGRGGGRGRAPIPIHPVAVDCLVDHGLEEFDPYDAYAVLDGEGAIDDSGGGDDSMVCEEGGEEETLASDSEVDELPPVVGPTRLGYFKETATGRDVGRVTDGFNGSSIGVRCNAHGCSIPMAEWKLPSRAQLIAWVSVPRPAADASKEERAAQKLAHTMTMKGYREAATEPGRTRKSLIDEAFDECQLCEFSRYPGE